MLLASYDDVTDLPCRVYYKIIDIYKISRAPPTKLRHQLCQTLEAYAIPPTPPPQKRKKK